MKSGSWPSVALIYAFGVLTSASLTKIIPLQEDLMRHVGFSPAGFAWLISLMSVPAALLATVVGSVIDRIGSRTAIICAAIAGAVANLLYLAATSTHAFQAIRVFEGLVMVGVYSAAPALIMATMSNERRGKAMAIWSTYTPVGVSLGLLLSGVFAGSAHWRGSYAVHGAGFAIMAVAGLLLPKPPATRHARPQAAGLLAAFTQPGPLRVALVFATLVMTGLGTNTVFPAWFAAEQGVSLGTASSIVGAANLTMIVGGVVTAVLVARGARHVPLYVAFTLAGLLAATAMFWPGIGVAPRLVSLVAWLVISGACIAVVTSMLPKVVANPLQGASAAGLLSQLAAATTFVTPLIWVPLLAKGQWPLFLAVIAVAGLAGILLFPRPRHEAGRQ